MIEIVPFKAWHAGPIFTKLLYDSSYLPEERHLEMLEKTNLAVSGLLDGIPIGTCGIVPLHKGVGEAWAYLTDEAKKHRFTLHRSVVRGLEQLRLRGNFHRVQTNVLYDFKAGHIWAERLGFIKEGPLFAFGPNRETFMRYAKVWL